MTEISAGPLIVSAPALRDQPDWIGRERDRLRDLAGTAGAILIRGLEVAGRREAATVARALSRELMAEHEGFTPRVATDGIYPAARWSPDQPMCMHHELSYSARPPGLLVFCCLVAPAWGGATAIADGSAVLRQLPPAVAKRFSEVGWELRRTYNDVVGVPWPAAFGTGDRAAVERYCDAHGIGFQWQDDGGLHTRRTLPAVLDHPSLGERVWFNQIAFLSEWTMDPAVREYLVAEFGADGLPFTTRYGDGELIDPEVIDLINDVYDAQTMREPWQAGDVLMVDNLRMAHSREPYGGSREVLVALGDPVSRS